MTPQVDAKDKRGRRIVFRLSDELYDWIVATKNQAETPGQFVRRILVVAKREDDEQSETVADSAEPRATCNALCPAGGPACQLPVGHEGQHDGFGGIRWKRTGRW